MNHANANSLNLSKYLHIFETLRCQKAIDDMLGSRFDLSAAIV